MTRRDQTPGPYVARGRLEVVRCGDTHGYVVARGTRGVAVGTGGDAG
jgi:hypothetical protein